MTTSGEIIIIGAGAAGLLAGRELSAQFKITILEARDVIGGRIHTVYKNEHKAAETGAEFVHGVLPVTLGLLKEAGLSYQLVNGNMYQVQNGHWDPQYEMIAGWDELLEKMGTITSDMTMQHFLDQYFPAATHSALHLNVSRFVQGYDLADMNYVSVKALYTEWTNESDNNFRIDKGYSALIHFLAEAITHAQGRIITNAAVTGIQWSPGQATVTTADGTTYTADKVIVTVPLGVLQQQAISFSPALPAHLKAAADIGWGTVIKAVLHFKTAFWETHAKDVGFIFGEAPFPTWWTQLPDTTPALTGWLGGPPAIPYLTQSPAAILDTALQSLATICNKDITTLQSLLTDSHVSNWAADPHIRGAYSYSKPETPAAQAILNTPVADTVYFAGEALYHGTSPGTVEAALYTGKQVADCILAAR
ncbi:flavin monoamine oxidase family protein [Chitinophaga rhizophila]|uniref:Tryptophan 2-monooxygenase n=1 Tax=Chitinophaga rhizophila TaxID=2866212 RepID=A0ABS7GJB5_9BACT|nr:NAD(P)/FAD-dependent oxidoreductase [Chitinophaga rhizophila]MBW8687784.1 FAD-dependent oxidoreductase [Chitinophaga rhizophila]